MNKEDNAKDRSRQAVEMLGSTIDVKINELTESNRQLRRKIFDLYTVFEISRNFNSVLNYKTLVDSFLLTSLGQVGASSAALFLPSSKIPGDFILSNSKGLLHIGNIEDINELSGPTAEYLSNIAKPLMIPEALENLPESESYLLLGRFENGIILPLIFKSNLKGLLILGGKVSGESFTSDDIEFLSILANQFVVALENARLYESEKTALKELQLAQKQIVLTERQAAVGELSANIAHEVNNPLSIISNYLHLAGRDIKSPDKVREHIGVVREELGRIAGIVRQLLDFHRPQKIEKTSLDIIGIIENTLSLLKWQLEKSNVKIECDYEEDLPNIKGSSEQLNQVFLNLVINARDFMLDGGCLKIKAFRSKDYTCISLTDSGPGIKQENLSRIFEPFFTTKEGSTGTGLGLSICYGIINEHNGAIIASNSPEGGSRFEIKLPVDNSGGRNQ